MPTISDTNLEYMRRSLIAVTKPCLYPFSGNDLDPITAVIAATPDPEDYPEGDYAVEDEDNWSAGKRGMRVIIRDQSTLEINYIGVARSNNSSGVLRIAGRQPGDRGIARFTPANIEVGNLVEMKQILPPYSFPTRGDPDTLELFKRWDDAFSTGSPQTEFPRPQGMMGGHIIGIAADADSAVHPGAYRKRIDPGASYSFNNNSLTFTWSVPGDGWTLISTVGTARTYDIEPGTYLLSILVTDSVTTKSTTMYRYVYIAEPGMRGGLLADERWTFAIENDRQTLAGRSMTLVITSDTLNMREEGPTAGALKNLVDQEFLPGTPVLFSYEHWHGLNEFGWGGYIIATHATTLEPILVSNYIGYVRDYQTSATRTGIESVRINLVSPIEYCDQLLFKAQELDAVDDPVNWQQVHRDLSNAAYVLHYILDNHTFLNSVHDVDSGAIGSGLIGDDDEAYPAPLASFYQPRWSLDGGTILETIQGIQRVLMMSNIGCTSNGSIKFRRHPLFEREAIRDSIPTVATIYDTDLYVSDDPEDEVLVYDRDDWLQIAECQGTFLITTDDVSTAEVHTAHTGLFASEQGRDVVTMPQFVALDQADGQLRVGNYKQLNNAQIKGITFGMQTSMDAFEPCMLEWWLPVIGQSDAFYPFPFDPLWTSRFLTGYRMLPVEVVRQWDLDRRGMLKTPFVTWLPESIGEPAPIKEPEIPATFGEWCHTDDFLVDNGGWATFLPTNGDAHPVDFWNGSGRGSYNAGIGWSAAVFTAGGGGYGTFDVGLSIKKSFDPCVVTRIEFYANVPGGFGGGTYNITAYYFENGGGEFVGAPVTSYGEINYALDLGEGVELEAIGLHIVQYTGDLPIPGLAMRVTMFGTGAISIDFGESNCG